MSDFLFKDFKQLVDVLLMEDQGRPITEDAALRAEQGRTGSSSSHLSRSEVSVDIH